MSLWPWKSRCGRNSARRCPRRGGHRRRRARICSTAARRSEALPPQRRRRTGAARLAPGDAGLHRSPTQHGRRVRHLARPLVLGRPDRLPPVPGSALETRHSTRACRGRGRPSRSGPVGRAGDGPRAARRNARPHGRALRGGGVERGRLPPTDLGRVRVVLAVWRNRSDWLRAWRYARPSAGPARVAARLCASCRSDRSGLPRLRFRAMERRVLRRLSHGHRGAFSETHKGSCFYGMSGGARRNRTADPASSLVRTGSRFSQRVRYDPRAGAEVQTGGAALVLVNRSATSPSGLGSRAADVAGA
jgi:hypothetical protein